MITQRLFGRKEFYKLIDEFWQEWTDDYKVNDHSYDIDFEHPAPKTDRIKWVYERMREHPEIKTVLDAGCGNGWHCRYLDSKGYKVEGIDVSKNAIALARRLNPTIRFMVKDLEKYVTKEHYDGLLCLNVLNNSYSYKRLLSHIAPLATYLYIGVDMMLRSKLHTVVWNNDELEKLFSRYGTIVNKFEGEEQNIYEIINNDYVA